MTSCWRTHCLTNGYPETWTGCHSQVPQAPQAGLHCVCVAQAQSLKELSSHGGSCSWGLLPCCGQQGPSRGAAEPALGSSRGWLVIPVLARFSELDDAI